MSCLLSTLSGLTSAWDMQLTESFRTTTHSTCISLDKLEHLGEPASFHHSQEPWVDKVGTLATFVACFVHSLLAILLLTPLDLRAVPTYSIRFLAAMTANAADPRHPHLSQM